MGRRLYFLLSLFLSVIFSVSAFMGSALAVSHSHKVCSTIPPAGSARCHAIVLTDGNGITPLAASTPHGYGPAIFKAAYGVRGQALTRVAVVVAYDAPDLISDVGIFSKSYGLPGLPVCSSSKQLACLEKLDQHGGRHYPAINSSWALETSLDVETVHGQCPGCRISLVEADNAGMANLASAVSTGVRLGAKVISNSYGGSESSGEKAFDNYYHSPGVITIASSGDNGYGTNYPAASPFVLAVGGTTLQMNSTKVVSETAWSGAGSGCSLFENKPVWQRDKKCPMRVVADLAADADPATGAAIYDSYPTGGRSGWFTVGGTSLAAPLVAGIVAASGDNSVAASYFYSSPGSIRDITAGSNGVCNNYLCRSGVGYDGPTGLGVLSHL